MINRRELGALLGALPLVGLTSMTRASEMSTKHRVTIEQFSFDPPLVVVQVGDRVQWTNADIAPHTASDLGRGWSTGALGQDDVGVLSFPSPGRFDYVCDYHPHMKGVVIVR